MASCYRRLCPVGVAGPGCILSFMNEESDLPQIQHEKSQNYSSLRYHNKATGYETLN